MRRTVIAIAAGLLALPALAGTRSVPGEAPATELPQPEILKRAGFDQKLGGQIPLDAVFRDETGAAVRLGDLLRDGRPAILNLVYYNCPMLCGLVMNGVLDVARDLAFVPGDEYDILTISFDAREGADLAAAKKANVMKDLARPGAERGWRFLTGDEPAIRSLTDAVGFRFEYDEQAKEFAHASGIMVVTPQGLLSHYFYGVTYAPRDVRLALVEASAGRIGSPVDQMMLFCYHYNPVTGAYSAAVMNFIRAGAAVTILAIAGFLVISFRRESSAHHAGRVAHGTAGG